MAKILSVVMLLPCVLASNTSNNASTNMSTDTSTNMSTNMSTSTGTNMNTNMSTNMSSIVPTQTSTGSTGNTGNTGSASSSSNTSSSSSSTGASSNSSSTSSSSNTSSGGSSPSNNSSSSSNASSTIITSTGNFSMTMSKAHATLLTSDVTAAKEIFKKAMAATLTGVSASEITIKRIYIDGVLVNGSRRLSSQSTPSVNSTLSTNSSSTDATVLVEWEINSATAVTADTAMTTLDNAIVSEALSAGIEIAIKEITVSVATTTAASKVGASGCMEWSVRTGLVSVMLAFFAFA